MATFSRQRLPWLSLLLMFGSYSLIGKLLAQGTYSKDATWVVLISSLLISLVYLDPLTQLKKLVQRLFVYDAIAFCVLVMLAATVSIGMYWFRIFLPMMMILMTEGLVRLDLKANRYNTWQTFFLLIVVTGLGLGYGWWLSK